jgi:hypothetical protein
LLTLSFSQTGPDGVPELFEDETTENNGGGLGRSEPGIFKIEYWDFPAENVEVVANGTSS